MPLRHARTPHADGRPHDRAADHCAAPFQGPVIKQRRLGEVIGRDRMRPDAPVGPILDAVVEHAFEATKCASQDGQCACQYLTAIVKCHTPCSH